jgi:hypothetical protein
MSYLAYIKCFGEQTTGSFKYRILNYLFPALFWIIYFCLCYLTTIIYYSDKDIFKTNPMYSGSIFLYGMFGTIFYFMLGAYQPCPLYFFFITPKAYDKEYYLERQLRYAILMCLGLNILLSNMSTLLSLWYINDTAFILLIPFCSTIISCGIVLIIVCFYGLCCRRDEKITKDHNTYLLSTVTTIEINIEIDIDNKS